MNEIKVEDIPDDWSDIRIETGGGRVISVLRDEGFQSSDCDYYLYYKNINEIVRLVSEWKTKDGKKLTNTVHMQKLIEIGLVIESF